MKTRLGFFYAVAMASLAGCAGDKVGERIDGGVMTPNHQLVRPAGESLSFQCRPVDMVLGANGRYLYAKDDRGIVVVDVTSWKVVQELGMKGGTSLHGICLSPDGQKIYATDGGSGLNEGTVAPDGKVTWKQTIAMPSPLIGGAAYPNGLLITDNGKSALVALSRSNSLAVVNLESGKVETQIPTDIAPYAVALAPDGRLLVTCWAATPAKGAKTAPSAGTGVEIDSRGIAVGGTVCVVDLKKKAVDTRIPVGLQPCDIQIDGSTAYIPNANSDTVSMIDLGTMKSKGVINVKPDSKLPFGSAPNATAIDVKSHRLFAALGGNNAIAQISLSNKRKIDGFIPAGWYPSAVLVRDGKMYVANAKGNGSRTKKPSDKGFGVYSFQGTITRMPLPDAKVLGQYTAQVKADLDAPRILGSLQRTANSTAKPVPVPAKLGDPSVFEHVVYILKENRTYDQVLGDIGKGDSDPSLCIYGQKVTPNIHALANEFALLDNYYCNGVNSADGHAWSIEGNASAYFEKTFGGWTRSYPFGDDPLSVSSSGFLWDSILAQGLSFRNYGEYDYAEPATKGLSYAAILKDFTSGEHKATFTQNIGVEHLRSYSCREFPGWNTGIPDVVRADIFMKELAGFEKNGGLPNMNIVYLPQDHTSGTSPGGPTPRAMVADNDLAVGRVIEAISKSKFWAKTCIFVIEDDPQDGFDHVDGHRSYCLVVSPYTKRGAVVSDFYNQTAMLNTMFHILGVPPMNQMVARSPLMTNCFTSKPDLTPYICKPNQIPLEETNPALKSLTGLDRELAIASTKIPLDKPDQGSDDLKNRILWNAAKRSAYPSQWAGAHGKGLAKRGLKLAKDQRPDEDDD